MAQGLTPVTIDASLGVALAVPVKHSERITDRVLDWVQRGVPIYVPDLWEYEVASALRRGVRRGLLSDEWAAAALAELLEIGVTRIAPEEALHREALRLAALLNLESADDAHYMAVVLRHGARFWTTNPALAQAAHAKGITWVSWIGEE